MATRLLTGAEIRRLLPMPACIDLMGEALAALARGQAILPLRTVMRLPSGGAFATMPAQLDQPEGFGLKVISVFPGNEGTRWDSHQGVVLLFEPEHGTLAALLDAAELTAVRTAAVSGLATRLLARPDAGDLALLGTGVQARTHLEAIAAVRPLRRVRVWSRQATNREAFVRWADRSLGVAVEPTATAREAVAGADLICTVTSSREPVLAGAWVMPGAHVNAVGASLPEARELDTDLVRRARLVVDRRESARAEAGDFLIPCREGAISDAHMAAELGEVVVGAAPGRTEVDQVTVFKSLGLAIEDLAAAHFVWREAERQNAGMLVELGGVKDLPARAAPT